LHFAFEPLDGLKLLEGPQLLIIVLVKNKRTVAESFVPLIGEQTIRRPKLMQPEFRIILLKSDMGTIRFEMKYFASLDGIAEMDEQFSDLDDSKIQDTYSGPEVVRQCPTIQQIRKVHYRATSNIHSGLAAVPAL
jgi:hypothetical protein